MRVIPTTAPLTPTQITLRISFLITMSLQPGHYLITNKEFQLPVGRGAVEDRSLNPKRVVCVDKNGPMGLPLVRWII